MVDTVCFVIAQTTPEQRSVKRLCQCVMRKTAPDFACLWKSSLP